MSGGSSNWIPVKRVWIALGIAGALAALALAMSWWSGFALLLLLPASGAGWAAFVMTLIRQQLGGGWEHRIHQLVVDRLALAADSNVSVLDIGCGEASLLIALLEVAPKVKASGVDYWGADWDYAQSACEARLSGLGLHATFARMDAAQLDFPDESFDIVVSVMCFHEVKTPRGSSILGPQVALGEALRMVRPGGTFVFIDRFADKSDFGDPAILAALLEQGVALRREPLVETLGIPWPLSTKRALGPAEIVSGTRAATAGVGLH